MTDHDLETIARAVAVVAAIARLDYEETLRFVRDDAFREAALNAAGAIMRLENMRDETLARTLRKDRRLDTMAILNGTDWGRPDLQEGLLLALQAEKPKTIVDRLNEDVL